MTVEVHSTLVLSASPIQFVPLLLMLVQLKSPSRPNTSRLKWCVGADLGAAKKAPVVEIVVAAGKRIAPGRRAVAAADMAADVKAAPVIDLRGVGDLGAAGGAGGGV